MPSAKTTTVPTLSKLLLAPLNNVDTCSLSSTNNNPFQTNTKFKAIANPSETFYHPHFVPNIGLSACLPSSSYVPTVIPTTPSAVITQNFTVHFVAMNKFLTTFDGLHHHYSLEEYSHQVDALMIFTMKEKSLYF